MRRYITFACTDTCHKCVYCRNVGTCALMDNNPEPLLCTEACDTCEIRYICYTTVDTIVVSPEQYKSFHRKWKRYTKDTTKTFDECGEIFDC